jgi:hypothetical protein
MKIPRHYTLGKDEQGQEIIACIHKSQLSTMGVASFTDDPASVTCRDCKKYLTLAEIAIPAKAATLPEPTDTEREKVRLSKLIASYETEIAQVEKKHAEALAAYHSALEHAKQRLNLL